MMTDPTRPSQMTRMKSTIMISAIAVMLVVSLLGGVGLGRGGSWALCGGCQRIWLIVLAAERRNAVVRARDTVEVDALAEWNDRHHDRCDRDDRQHQPAVGGDLTGGVALVRLLDQADDLRNHRVEQDNRGQDESEELPDRTNRHGGHRIEVLSHFHAALEDP